MLTRAPMERVCAMRSLLARAAGPLWRSRHANGHPPAHRLPNTLNVSCVGMVGAEVLARLDGVAASTGSACHSGRVELSPVLAAMGVPEKIGPVRDRGGLRTGRSDRPRFLWREAA
jgi:cysteine desulfurase